MRCPSCGTDVPEDARFCPSCGHALVRRPDERRVATVLFADLVGFTTFSESADPEHVKNTVDECFEALGADVREFGGQVDKIVGDALIALFGAPIAHEDDAERAVRAALRMQETLATRRESTGIPVEMRIGVNTGEVLVGALRAGGDYTAMGDAVNVAARLQQVAAPGQVVVGPVTRAAAATGISYDELGPIVVRGREEPVVASVAVAALAPPGVRRHRPRTPLVGRDAEMGVLRALLRASTERSRAQLVVLAGEAGVGKTRLAEELGAEAERQHEARVLTGHCVPYGESNPWWPIATMLHQACDVDTDLAPDVVRARTRAAVADALDVGTSEVERVTQGLLYLMALGGPGAEVDPARARTDALRAAAAFFDGLAAERPLVVVISDLHWAQDGALELVERLLQRLRTRPFLLVGTTRPDGEREWEPPSSRHNTTILALEPLGAAETDELARRLLGDDADAGLLDALRERSGGNPFFIEELANVLCEQGAATVRAGARGQELPATLHGLVAARLDALPDDERAMLQDASVIGASGRREVAVALARLRDDRATGLLIDRLRDRDLLEVADGEFAFRNELVRDVAYSTLTKADRARRHAMLARHLAEEAEGSGRVDELLDQLAHHFNAAAALTAELGPAAGLPVDLAAKAVAFLERAADRAEQREGYAIADRYLTHALDLVDRERRADVLRLRAKRAKARAEVRDLHGARGDLVAAGGLADLLDDARAQAWVLTIQGDVEQKEGDPDGADATLAAAIERWRALGDDQGLADALRARGMALIFHGRTGEAEQFVSEALGGFRTVGDRRGEAWALQNLAWISFVRGDIEEAERRADRSAELFGEIADWGGLGWSMGLLAWIRFNQGRLDESEGLANQVLEEARELGNRWAMAMMQVLLADIAHWTGRQRDALRLGREALDAFQEVGDRWGVMQASVPVALALNALGRTAETHDLLADLASNSIDPAGRPELVTIVALAEAALALQRGDADALEQVRREGIADAADTLAAGERLTQLAIALLQAGDAPEALEAARRASGLSSQRGPAAAAATALALAQVAAGDAAGALTTCANAAETAVTYRDQLGLQLAEAFAHLRLGDAPGTDAAFGRATQVVDATESRLDRLVVAHARAAIEEALHRADAEEAAAAAELLGEDLGHDAPGWRRLMRLLAGLPLT